MTINLRMGLVAVGALLLTAVCSWSVWYMTTADMSRPGVLTFLAVLGCFLAALGATVAVVFGAAVANNVIEWLWQWNPSITLRRKKKIPKAKVIR